MLDRMEVVKESKPTEKDHKLTPKSEALSLDNFICPITQEEFKDPVILCDGHTYERFAITGWLKNNDTSPMTNEVLSSKQLTTNWSIKNAIEEYNKNIIPKFQKKVSQAIVLKKTLAKTREQLKRTEVLLRESNETLKSVQQFLSDNQDLFKNSRENRKSVSTRFCLFPCVRNKNNTEPLDITRSFSRELKK